jgi:hypothetical protein
MSDSLKVLGIWNIISTLKLNYPEYQVDRNQLSDVKYHILHELELSSLRSPRPVGVGMMEQWNDLDQALNQLKQPFT